MTAAVRTLRPAAVIRPARPEDLDALVALEQASFNVDQATRRAIRYALRSPTMSLLAAFGAGGRLVGAATVERRAKIRSARLSSLAVARAQAGRGLGRLLLEAVEADARAHGCTRVRLEARTDNVGAIRLYERSGYRRYAVKADYYEDGATAWCFEKALAPD